MSRSFQDCSEAPFPSIGQPVCTCNLSVPKPNLTIVGLCTLESWCWVISWQLKQFSSPVPDMTHDLLSPSAMFSATRLVIACFSSPKPISKIFTLCTWTSMPTSRACFLGASTILPPLMDLYIPKILLRANISYVVCGLCGVVHPELELVESKLELLRHCIFWKKLFLELQLQIFLQVNVFSGSLCSIAVFLVLSCSSLSHKFGWVNPPCSCKLSIQEPSPKRKRINSF